jgi:hypothetical protein
MLRTALISLVVLLGVCSPALAGHGLEPALPEGAAPADRAAFPTYSSPDGTPMMWAGAAGDVNGDGRDDVVASVVPYDEGWSARGAWVLFTPPAGTRYAEAVGSRPGFQITGLWGDSQVGPAGDVNGDGLGDVAVASWSTVAVIFGKRDRATVDVEELGAAGYRIVGPSQSWWSGGVGVGVGNPAVNVGDQNGDGRDDLVVGSTGAAHLVYTPEEPAGVTAHVESAPGRRFTAPTWSQVHVASLGDTDGDGRDDLLTAWRADSAEVVEVVGLSLAGEGQMDLRQAAETGVGWELHGTGFWMSGVAGLREPGGTRRPLVAVDGLARLLEVPAKGTEHSLGAVGHVTPGGDSLVDVGDQDSDGRADLGSGDMIVYRDSTRESYSGVQFPWTEFRSVIAASLDDLDGDGWRDLAVARVRHSQRSPEGWDTVADWAIEIHHSRSWPHDHDPSRLARQDPYAQPCCHGSPYPPGYAYPWGAPSPRPAGPAPRRPTARGRSDAVSETPAYKDGHVDMTLRTPRSATVTAEASAAGWRPGGPAWLLGDTEVTGGNEPWVHLRFTLPPEARQVIEADGRLRLWVAMKVRASGRTTTPPALTMVVVTRPRAAAFGTQRQLRGSFGVQRLLGGPLADLITGESADDVLRGGAGTDALHGGTGNDTLFGDDAGDLLDGDDGDDALHGGAGRDQLVELRFGDDTLRGDADDDWVAGGRGEDTVHGGPGDDVLAGGSGPDEVQCGAGEDIVFVNFSAERERVEGCEHVYDEPGVIHMPCADRGTPGPETLLGTEGEDRCVAGAGADDLEGRGGDDVLVGEAGDDRLFGRFGRDTLLGGDGADELEGGRGADVLRGGAGNDRLNGGYDPDVVAGGPGADRIIARGGGRDRIDCGPGVDTVYADSRDRLRGCERVRRSGRG